MTRLTDKVQAQKILADITPAATGFVEKIETLEKQSKPPALYDLLTLQKDANRQFGYTAQQTLDIAQSLYEEYKILSYPRTESRHLSSDMVEELPPILSTVLRSHTTSPAARSAFAKEGLVPGSLTADLIRPRLSKAYVDDAKLTDHHAIIPTNKTLPEGLPEQQLNVYLLVATRFLSIFLPPEIRDDTEALIRLANHVFRARGSIVKDPGWTILEPNKIKAEEPELDSQQLPPLALGQKLPKRKAEIKEGKTAPPKPYDDAGLLTAMKNAGKDIGDEDLAAYMKQSGLGTPATRAAIIERLVHSGYVERSKRVLLPTEKGKALIAVVHSDLKNVALTATWEQQLSDIIDGRIALATFEKDIANFILRLLPEVTQSGAAIPRIEETGLGPCPQCKEGIVRETPKGAGCSRWKEGCKFSVWREQYGKKLTDSQLKDLIEKGKTRVIKGFKRKDGSGTYDARLVLNEEFKIRLDFDKTV